MRRTLALTTAGFATLLASGCSLPSKERWAQINRHGLLPVLIDGRSSSPTVTAATSKPSEERVVRVQAVTTPAVVRTPSAARVPGNPGYVFSPHTIPHKVVDVRGLRPGEEVRCPYTGLAFLVPAAQSDIVVSRPTPAPHVDRPVAELVSNSDTVPDLGPELNRPNAIEAPTPVPAPAPLPPPTVEPAKPATAETTLPPPAAPPTTPAPAPAPPPTVVKGKNEIPYGTRVAGRPGFVYSPYANKSQLVDVATTAPGVVVRCPYTQKLFRVPELAGEEVKPSGTPPTSEPPATADTPATPPTPEPAPAPPAPAPEPRPATPGSLASPPR